MGIVVKWAFNLRNLYCYNKEKVFLIITLILLMMCNASQSYILSSPRYVSRYINALPGLLSEINGEHTHTHPQNNIYINKITQVRNHKNLLMKPWSIIFYRIKEMFHALVWLVRKANAHFRMNLVNLWNL